MKISKFKIVTEIVLVISILILIGMIVYDYNDMKKTENYTNSMVSELDIIIENNEKNIIVEKNNNSEANNNETKTETVQTSTKTVQISGCNVFGKIKIDKIGIEYPIIEYTDAAALWKSICKISNNNIDGTGNLCLAGHNMRNMSMFGNLRKLNNGDEIKITDLYGNEYVYEVYEKTYINPEQVEILRNTDESIVTLITCNDASNKRLIVRGKLIKEQ